MRKVNEDRVIELEQEMEELNGKIEELKSKLTNPEEDRLSIEEFLNLSKNAGVIVQSANAIIKDKICREIFLNFTVDEEKVLSYQLKPHFAEMLKSKQHRTSRVISKNSNFVFAKVGGAPLFAPPSIFIRSAFGLALCIFCKSGVRAIFIIYSPAVAGQKNKSSNVFLPHPTQRENFLLPILYRNLDGLESNRPISTILADLIFTAPP